MARARRRRKRRIARRIAMAAQNALELIRAGRLTAPYGAPFEVVHEDRVYKLRHYQREGEAKAPPVAAPLVLVPPLMVASEIYDIAPDISAVGWLTRHGVDVWLVDYGAPEREEGGMDRTFDDHIEAIDDAIDRVRAATGHDVHLAGYSQGGMFVYQTAAFRRSRGIASLITFGSPVDIHRSLPAISDDLTERAIDVARTMIELPLRKIDGLPGALTSTGFKVLSARKELSQLVDFVRKLHDRQALEKRESKRLFLGGGGFVAWPGPALRTFIDEMVVNNRMTSGGFVIAGQTVSLSDINTPILYFVGEHDDFARPPTVRAISKAAPSAEPYEVELRAGHFGLVVGSMSLEITWPTVVDWMRWHEGKAARPTRLVSPTDPEPLELEDSEMAFEVQFDLNLFYDVLANGFETVWNRLGDVTRDITDAVDGLRWQVSRLSRLHNLEPNTRISIGLTLAQQARSIPDRTFFLWQGRAFSYADADRRVDAVVRGLICCGVRPGRRVGVLMKGRPSYLTLAAALSRIGAVAVLLNPDTSDQLLAQSLELAKVDELVTDPEHAARGRAVYAGGVFVLGSGDGGDRSLPSDVVDMEEIEPDAVELPSWYTPNPGRAADLALIIFTAGRSDKLRAARITNRRWAFSALGAAAACTLTPKDTVYCTLPLHHAAGTMVSTGAALVGGSRLALSTGFSPEGFWEEVRRYGVTVVFYAGAMCRALVNAPHVSGEKNHPVRLFAGSGMRADAWERLVERFGPVGVLEFYASTEGTVVLANASGEKIGAVGRPLPGSAELALVAYDFTVDDFVRDEKGHHLRCTVDQIGMLIARTGSTYPTGTDRIRHNVFEPGDTWFFTGDLLRRDGDGDYWFVDRLVNIIRTAEGPVSTVDIEGALYRLPEVELAVAYGVAEEDSRYATPVATIELRDGVDLNRRALLEVIVDRLEPHARPRVIRCVDRIEMTDGFRPLKGPLRRAGLSAEGTRFLLEYGNDYGAAA